MLGAWFARGVVFEDDEDVAEVVEEVVVVVGSSEGRDIVDVCLFVCLVSLTLSVGISKRFPVRVRLVACMFVVAMGWSDWIELGDSAQSPVV